MLFENFAGFQAAESTLVLPNVSYCVQENGINYKPDPSRGHAYVEIAGIKWATMNIGASSESDAGLYFQWGDTQGYTSSQIGTGSEQRRMRWIDYKYSNNGGSGESDMTKYNLIDNKTVLDASDDAAVANWGGKWRMPTEAEFTELLNNTDALWCTYKGYNGYKLTSKTDSAKFIFFPCAGYCTGNEVSYKGRYGAFWCSSIDQTNVTHSLGLYIGDSFCNMTWDVRKTGSPIRPILDI